jgi:hypothetical protein
MRTGKIMPMFCSDGREAKKLVVVEVAVVSDAPLLPVVVNIHSACKCTSLRNVNFCLSLVCIEDDRVSVLLLFLFRSGVRSISTATICDVNIAKRRVSLPHTPVIIYLIRPPNLIHWCTISTPHPQWSSGYDFRVSIV